VPKLLILPIDNTLELSPVENVLKLEGEPKGIPFL
jgi:hypothetical protein